MAIACFVGCDKTGKSTLFQSVLKKTNSIICIDRFTACQYVYGMHYDKGNDTPTIDELRTVEKKLSEVGGFFVHVTAYVEDIMQRFEEHNEKDIEMHEISKILEDYEVYLKNASMPVLRINTSRMSIEEAAEKIITFASQVGYYVNK